VFFCKFLLWEIVLSHPGTPSSIERENVVEMCGNSFTT
jgi:hypothetical protein